MHLMKTVVTNTQLSDYTVEKSENMCSNFEEVIFLTKQQQSIINTKPRRVIFTSDFGTGKTLLLKTQAKQLAELKKHPDQPNPGAKSKIVFVVFLEDGFLLANDIKRFATNYWNMEVLCLTSGQMNYNLSVNQRFLL